MKQVVRKTKIKCGEIYIQNLVTPKFSIGGHVRITKKKKIFDKGYTQRWTVEVFTISKIKLTIPVTYKITDYSGEEIQVRFMNKNFKRRSRTYLG